MKLAVKTWVPVLLDGLHLLALAVWLGGLVTFWLAVMPAAFHTSGLTMRQAEAVVGDSLRGFTGLVEMCGIAMAGVQFALRRRYQTVRALFVADGIRQLLTFGALLLAEVNLRVLLPQMDAARQQAHVVEFHNLHHNYAVLATLQALILLVVCVLTAWLQTRSAGIGTPLSVSKTPLSASASRAVSPSASPTTPDSTPLQARPPSRHTPKSGRHR